MQTECKGNICPLCSSDCTRSHKRADSDELMLRRYVAEDGNVIQACWFCAARINWKLRTQNSTPSFLELREAVVKHTVGEGGRECPDCGLKITFENVHMFQFDHKDEDNKMGNIGSMIAREEPLQKILNEIKWTEVVCIECHNERTWSSGLYRSSNKPIITVAEIDSNGNIEVYKKINLRAIAQYKCKSRKVKARASRECLI